MRGVECVVETKNHLECYQISTSYAFEAMTGPSIRENETKSLKDYPLLSKDMKMFGIGPIL